MSLQEMLKIPGLQRNELWTQMRQIQAFLHVWRWPLKCENSNCLPVRKTFTITNVSVWQPSFVLTQLPPVTEPNSVTCAATFCGPDTSCRIVYNPRTRRVGPRCVAASDLPSNSDNQGRCSIGEPLLFQSSYRRGRLSVFKCRRTCPAPGLVCSGRFCCAEDTNPVPLPPPTIPRTCADLVCEPGFRCVLKGERVPCPPPPCASDPIPCPYACPAIARLVPTCEREQVEKPGQCPNPAPAGPCIVQCADDSACRGDEKCCKTACGGAICTDPATPPITCANLDCLPSATCVDTPTGPKCEPINTNPVVKPGQCPEVRPGQAGICVEGCASDGDCRGDLKCCSNGCGRTCSSPVQRRTCALIDCLPNATCVETPTGPRCVPIKPGSCPIPRNCGPIPQGFTCQDTCSSDSDCHGSDKCCEGCSPCKTCVLLPCSLQFCPRERPVCLNTPRGAECVARPDSPPSKPGQCPGLISLDTSQCDARCQGDADCPGQEKCCRTGCGGAFCSQPLGITCASVLCPVTAPCVETPTGAECQPLNPDKPGSCPLPRPCAPPPPGPPTCTDQCSSDRDCPGTEKCCRDCQCNECRPASSLSSCRSTLCPVGTRCVESPFGPRCERITVKPGVCPPKRCALHQPPTTCTDTCKDDGDCRGSDKCCQGCDGCRQCIFATGLPTCRVLDCPAGTRCVEGRSGATCRPTAVDKPGTCPAFRCPVPDSPTCRDACSNDGDCKGSDKCCWSCTGCKACLSALQLPRPSCATVNLFCMRGTRCVDTPDGPRCGPINGEDRCSLPPDTGPCEAAITRYYFRSSGPEPGCHTFTYGGCKGNGNNFETLSACLNACARVVG